MDALPALSDGAAPRLGGVVVDFGPDGVEFGDWMVVSKVLCRGLDLAPVKHPDCAHNPIAGVRAEDPATAAWIADIVAAVALDYATAAGLA